MEKLQWFKFSPTDWSMGKIQRCPEITQARYIRLCCLYWNKEANLSYEDAEIDIDKEHLDILVSKKIVECIDDNVVIKFLDEQLVDITANSKSKSKAAKARWDKYKSKEVQSTTNADAMHVHTDAMQNDAEKRRGEETREEKRKEEKIIEDKPYPDKSGVFNFDKYLIFINETLGKNHKVVNKKVRSAINARLKEGYTNKDISKAIVNIKKSEYHINSGFSYCTPEFFSRSETIDKYSKEVTVNNSLDKNSRTQHMHVEKKLTKKDWADPDNL